MPPSVPVVPAGAGRGGSHRLVSGREPDAGHYYYRFNRRFDRLQHWLMLAFPIIFSLVVLFQSVTFVMAAIHLTAYATVALFRRATRPRDAMVTFFVTYPFWFYNFTLFAYALLHWQSPETPLYSPWLSSSVALVALLSCVTGYVIYRLFMRFIGLPAARKPLSAQEKQDVGVFLILLAAPFMMLPFAGPGVSIFNAASGLFAPFLWLGLIVYCVGRGPEALYSLPVLLVALLSLAISFGLNARGILLSFGITGLVIYFALAERPITPVRAAALYIGANALSAISAIMIGARLTVGHEASAPLVLRSIFSSNFVMALLGLGQAVDTSLVLKDTLVRHDQYLVYFYDGRGGLFERLTLLPIMDIIIGHLPNFGRIDWAEIKNTIVSALPSVFGQEKLTGYSDRLAWGVGLIDKNNVSHPTVTLAGEAYAMGGMFVLFGMVTLIFASTLIWYEYSKGLFADRFVAAASLLTSSIYIVFSSTAISAVGTPLRIYPAIAIIYPMVCFATARLASSKARSRRFVERSAARTTQGPHRP